MLTELSIFDVVLIERVRLSFDKGLTAMTGETGSGKSIILDALGLALGARADRALVRAGCKQAQIIANFCPEPQHPVWALLEEMELGDGPDEELILRRIIAEDGKSKGFINDIPVSAGVLRKTGNLLVEIHGQHDGRGLMDTRTHIQALDAFGELQGDVNRCSQAFNAWTNAKKQAEALALQAKSDASEQIYLQEAAHELDRMDPKPGEEQSLASMRNVLMQSEQLLGDIENARKQLDDMPGPEDQIGSALRNIETALTRMESAQSDDPARKSLLRTQNALEQSLVELDEARLALQDAAHKLSVEPEKLEMAEERLFELRALARKHKTSVDQLPEIRRELARRLETLENLEHAQVVAAKEVSKTKEAYQKCVTGLSKKRTAWAHKLDKAILQELQPLRLEKARFETKVDVVEIDAGNAIGINRVSFEISANPGTPLGPLSSIASGGELSRVSLAIKAAMADKSAPGLMIFDEIDQGVGGAVADAVGRRLAVLSQENQVLVITHSPQVAARANVQFQIEKSEQNGVSTTKITPLEKAQREEEIARMLAGAKITDEAREAAKALLGS